MPIEHALWRVDRGSPTPLHVTALDDEKQLEDAICANSEILDSGWMLIGRQVRTDHGKLVDLLAVDAGGALIVIELKKDRTPREVVACERALRGAGRR